MISVCLATYNGMNYLAEQLNSILPQLGKSDELIIVDDCSSDSTFEYLLSLDDSRINLSKNDRNLGVIKTFEKAILLSKGDFIFLSDQDDIWLEGHLDIMLESLLSNNCDLVSSNFTFIDSTGNFMGDMKMPLKEKDSNRYFKNILKIFLGNMHYFGCCMVIRRRFLQKILPIPSFVESHDLWIATVANLNSTNYHLEYKLLSRRIHGTNVSVVNRNMFRKIISRFIFLASIIVIFSRNIKNND